VPTHSLCTGSSCKSCRFGPKAPLARVKPLARAERSLRRYDGGAAEGTLFVDVAHGNNACTEARERVRCDAAVGYAKASGVGVPHGICFGAAMCPYRVAGSRDSLRDRLTAGRPFRYTGGVLVY